MHQVGNDLVGLRYHVDSLRKWRDETARQQFDALGRRCDELAKQIDQVLKSDEIAQAVADKVNQTNTLRLSFVQKLSGLVIGAASLAAAVKVLLG